MVTDGKLTAEDYEQLNDFKAMAEEVLLPELQSWVEPTGIVGPQLRHPLLYDLGLPMPGMANRRFRVKQQQLAEYLEAGDLFQIVFVHEKPWRLWAFQQYVYPEGTLWEAPPEIQDLALDIWVNSENIHQHQVEWRQLFSNRPKGAPILGNEDERAAFDELPDRIPVYRGGGPDSFLSWTTDRAIAERFASRSKRPVRERTIAKADAFAYLTRRGESEILSWRGQGS